MNYQRYNRPNQQGPDRYATNREEFIKLGFGPSVAHEIAKHLTRGHTAADSALLRAAYLQLAQTPYTRAAS